MLLTAPFLEHQLSASISHSTAWGARTETAQTCQALQTMCESSNLKERDFIFPHPGDGFGIKKKGGKKQRIG